MAILYSVPQQVSYSMYNKTAYKIHIKQTDQHKSQSGVELHQNNLSP